MVEAACLGVGRGGGIENVGRLGVGRGGGMVEAGRLGVERGRGMPDGMCLGVIEGGGRMDGGRLGAILSIGEESYLCEAITMRMICLRYSRFSGCDSSSSPMIISLSMYM